MYLIEKEQMNVFDKCKDIKQAYRVLKKLIKESKVIDLSSLSGLHTTAWRDTYLELISTGKYGTVIMDYESGSLNIDRRN
jgi:hypothetical protein